jgi:hypothetical protein
MIRTQGQFEPFKGSAPSISPTVLPEGVFSLCSGGVPVQGAFGRLPGKTMRNLGDSTGGAISIYQFGTKVVVQRVVGIQIFELADLAPAESDFLRDNEGNLVYDNSGIAILV